MIAGAVARIRSLWRGVRKDSALAAEMAEEFRVHVEMRTDDLIRSGLDPAEARRQAHVEFGAVEKHREEGRAARGLGPFDQLRFSWLDVRLGIRMLIKYPGLTVVGVLSLAFAIFTGTVGFEITKRAVYPKVSVADRARVVSLEGDDVADFLTWREQLTSIESLGALRLRQRNLVASDGRTAALMLVEVTPAALGLTGVRPFLGRSLVEADERPEAPAVVVLAYEVWRTDLGGDPEVIGSTVRLGNEPHVVVGVMPERFSFPEHWFNSWVPLRFSPADLASADSDVGILGRLAPGVTIAEAQAELDVFAQRTSFPGATGNPGPQVTRFVNVLWENEGQGVMVLSLNIFLVMLLIIVSSTVALLIFARAATRENELAVRTALGAGRGRIMMQLVAESLVLAAVASAVGLVAAEMALRWNFGLPEQGFVDGSGLTTKTVLYAVTLSAVAAATLGILPALKVTRGLAARLRQATPGGGGFRFGGLWTTVVVAQVAFTVPFPVAWLLVSRDVSATRDLPGEARIPTDQILAFMLQMDNERETELGDVPGDSVRAREFMAAYRTAYEELERRLEAEPGVRAVTFGSALPTLVHPQRRIELDAGEAAPIDPRFGFRAASVASVALDFFNAMDAPVLAGRGFDAGDLESGAPVVVVNESFVERTLGGADPIGRRIRYLEVDQNDGEGGGPWHVIVGVVRDLGMGKSDGPSVAGIYHPSRPDLDYGVLVAVRVSGPPASFVPRLDAIAAAVSPTLRLDDPGRFKELGPTSLSELSRVQRIFELFLLGVTTTVSLVALLLSLAGIYAVMSFTVWQRTREIGLRVALGADARRIVGVILRRPLAQVGLGILLGGLITAALVSKGFAVISGKGAALLLGYALLMTGVCMLAALVPIRRLLSVEPVDALKADG